MALKKKNDRRGRVVPSFFSCLPMLNAEHINQLVLEHIHGSGIFLVDIKVSKGNKISVFIDRLEGLAIDDCVALSRFLEEKLDREANDFELEVSSPGLDAPFKVPEQYSKAVGRTIQVLTLESKKLEGVLKKVEDQTLFIELLTKKKKAVNNPQETEVVLPLTQIKSTKELLIIK